MTPTDDDRPQPPKRSSSSSAFIDERRSRFEQQQLDNTTGSTTDRPSTSRVGELKTAFETTTITREDSSKSKGPISTSLTEQRRRLFEEQEQGIKDRSSSTRRSVRKFAQLFAVKKTSSVNTLRSPWVNNCFFLFLECKRVCVCV